MATYSLQFIIFLSNILTAFSFFIVTYTFSVNFYKMKVAHYLFKSEGELTRKLIIIISVTLHLFALSTSLCGITHVLNAVEYFVPNPVSYHTKLKCSILIICSIVTFFTAMFSLYIFPFIRTAMNQHEISNEGTVQFVSALERMQKSIVIMSADLRFMKGNAITAKYFGENYLGRSIFEVITDNDDICKFQIAFERLAADTHSEEAVSVIFKNNARWLESKIRIDNEITPDGQKNIEYTIMTRDIDAQKNNEILQKVVDENKLQEIVTQSKLMYITSVAHDLKAPLQTFCFGLELIFKTALTATQQEILNQLKVASELMKLSISQSIDISKALDNRIILPRKSAISLSETMDQVKIIMMGNSCSVPISFSISPCIEDNIITDREWLWQMLLNLLTNASKYTIEGSIAVTVDFVIDEQCLLFQVIDTGIGVSDEKKKTIFDAFNQAQIGQVTGTGLGLYGLRCRVQALGGICGIKDNKMSSTGTGSIFWFQIPYITSNQIIYNNEELKKMSTDHYDSSDDVVDARDRNSISNIPFESLCRSNSFLRERIDNTSSLSSTPFSNNLSLASKVTSDVHEELTLLPSNESFPNALNPLIRTTYTNRPTSSSEKLTSSSNELRYTLLEKKTSSSVKTTKSTSPRGSITLGRYRVNTTDEQISLSLQESPSYITPLHIFLIDDSLTILKMTRLTLGTMGFTHIECFENGYAGLVAMKKKYVDIVFTDVQMPVLTGPEMAQRFREFEKTVLGTEGRIKRQIIIALTANTSVELSALVPSVFDHICTKPIDSKDLMNMIQRFCNLRNIGDNIV